MKIEVQQKKKTIGLLFDTIASSYDFLNHLLTLNIDKIWRKKTVKRLPDCILEQNKNKYDLLDIACGTGDLSIEIIKQQKAEHILGVDLSEKMLEIAKQKIEKLSLSDKITFMQEDCQQLPFEDNSFVVVTCGFGVRNFNDLQAGLKQMYRVLQPKGKVVILEFSYPKNLVVKAFYNIYFTYILTFIGKIVSKNNNAYKYLMQSVKEFPKGEDFLHILHDCGFENCKYKSLTCGIVSIYSAEKL